MVIAWLGCAFMHGLVPFVLELLSRVEDRSALGWVWEAVPWDLALCCACRAAGLGGSGGGALAAGERRAGAARCAVAGGWGCAAGGAGDLAAASAGAGAGGATGHPSRCAQRSAGGRLAAPAPPVAGHPRLDRQREGSRRGGRGRAAGAACVVRARRSPGQPAGRGRGVQRRALRLPFERPVGGGAGG
jgi:hypothetical protein